MASTGDEKQGTIENFDGSDPGSYRLWKRRAQLLVAALPTTVSKEKYGPRLMQYIKGEAEQLCEGISVEDLCSEGGDVKIFKLLDEKYGPRPVDLLHRALKTYFYELTIRPSETYQQFLARYASSVRLLREQSVELPEVVLGYMLLKKLKLDASSEAILLTATKGNMRLSEITAALQAVFPEGKGGHHAKTKEIFMASNEEDAYEELENNEVQEAMETVVDEWQGREGVDDEDILEAFESYADVRRRMAERKKARGFSGGPEASQQWRLSGSVSGRIQLLKAKTRCHHCKKIGHWRRECPALQGKGGGKLGRSHRDGSATGSSGKDTEVHVIEENDSGGTDVYMAEHYETLEILNKFREKVPKQVAWKEDMANDVGNAGNADTHATGNRQRVESGAIVASCAESPAEKVPADVLEVTKQDQANRQGQEDPLNEGLSLEGAASSDPFLAECGVPDTACRRTLVGAYTLSCIERLLAGQGFRIRRASERNDFGFGNNGTLTSEEVAIIPARVGPRIILIRAAVLKGTGSKTPLLLSKELLRTMGAVIDTQKDRCEFKHLNCGIDMVETSKGHYGIPLFDRLDKAPDECHVAQPLREKQYDIKKLEQVNEQNLVFADQEQRLQESVVAAPEPLSERHGRPGAGQGVSRGEGDGTPASDGLKRLTSGKLESSRSGTRRRCGRARESSERADDDDSRQVQPEKELEGHLRVGQAVHHMGSHSRDQELGRGHHDAEGLHGPPRCRQDQQASGREDLQHASHKDGELPTIGLLPEQWPNGGTGHASQQARLRHGDGVHWLGEGGARANRARSPSMGSSHNEGDGPAADQDRVPGSPLSRRCDEAEDDGDGTEPLQVKVSRKTRRRLHKATIDVCQRPTEQRTVELDGSSKTQCANIFHVHMSTSITHQDGVSEVFSLPRVVPVAEKKGLGPGRSYDQLNGWNFLLANHRKQCLQEIADQKPLMVIVSPPCVEYSVMQNCSRDKRDPEVQRRGQTEAQILLNFAMQVCELQSQLGNFFVFEHPAYASSWAVPSVQHVWQLQHVSDVILDQCCFGLRDPCNHKLYRKTTRLLTNCKQVQVGMARRCDKQHEHQQLQGQVKVGGAWINRTRLAQVYPKAFVETLVTCIRRALRQRESELVREEKEVCAVEELRHEDEHKLVESLRRCHNNLGHPSKERFLHMLKSANASPQAIKLAKSFKCSVCESMSPPVSHNVSKHKRAEVFNEQIMMDTFDLPLQQGKKVVMLNICDEGTGMQLCVPLWKGKKAEHVRDAYRKNWKRWAGVPTRVLTDGGTEFDGVVQEGFEMDGSVVTKTAAYAPWQNGVTERHGGIWKQAFNKAAEEVQPTTKRELRELMDQVNHARNSLCRKHGYAPYQHVFGSDLRLPGLVTDPLNVVHNSAVVHGVDSVVASHAMRQAARLAFVKIDDEDKVRRALEHRSRPMRGPFNEGDHVYYWRRYPKENNRGRWHGPAVVIGSANGRSRIWIASGNKVLRCAPEQLRRATEDQEAAIRWVSPEVIAKQRKERGAQIYVDISNADKPRDDDMRQEVPVAGIKRSREQAALDETEVATEPTDEPAMSMPEDVEESRQTTEGQSGDTPVSYPPIVSQDLEQALRHSVETLDHGVTRLSRTPLVRSGGQPPESVPLPESEDEVWEVYYVLGDDGNFEVYNVQKNRAEIHEKDMTEGEKIELKDGMRKEWQKLLDTGSIVVHVGKEAKRLREEVSKEQMLESRFVKTRREKPGHPGQQEVKCRWCIKGFRDPEVDIIDKQSPTLAADTLAMVLQVIASKRWVMTVADVEGAFLQGPPLERPCGRLFVQLPSEGVPGVSADVMIEVKKHEYGLCDAPRHWWLCFSAELQKLGMRQSQLDPCCFYWFDRERLEGILAFHVDDLVFGGSQLFENLILPKLKQRFPFKHWQKGEAKFLGRRLIQKSDFSIVSDQKEYASQVSPAPISKDRRRQKNEPLSSREMTQYRGILGAANWLVSSTRPDIAATNAMLQQRISRATVGDLIEANRLVGTIKDFAFMSIHYKSIPLEKGVFLLATDASWANGEDLRSQAAHVILFAEEQLASDRWAHVTPLRWRSFKLERHTQSTLGSELMSLARGIAECEWMRSLFAEATNHDYELSKDQEFRERTKAIITIDNKPIYDHTQGDGIVVKDKRLAIDMLLVRRDIRRSNMTLRWVDTRQMIADPLTKTNADASFLRFLIRYGEYILIEENRSLEWRSKEKVLRKQQKEMVNT